MSKKVFFAGASSFTGKAVLAVETDIEWVCPLRRGSPRAKELTDDPRAVVVDFQDTASVTKAMAGCRAILSTIGTTRAQFAKGVSYETVDYGINMRLLEAAATNGIEHFVLMSSLGAGHPMGPYLSWKARVEKAVIDSQIPYTIVRPSYLVGTGRPWPKSLNALSDTFSLVPGLSALMKDVKGVPIEVVAWNFVRILAGPEALNQILSGRDLWTAWKSRK